MPKHLTFGQKYWPESFLVAHVCHTAHESFQKTLDCTIKSMWTC